VGLRESRSLDVWMDTPEELPAGHMGAAAHIRKCEDQLRPTARDLCTRVADGGIF